MLWWINIICYLISLGVIFAGLYGVIYFLVIIQIDCDFGLKFAELFGKKIDSLSGKVVWVTGASSGIGEAISKSLGKHGVKLVLSARRINELERVKEEILENSNLEPRDVLILPMDMIDLDNHNKLLNDVITHFGRLDILVNNAGRSQRAKWVDIDIEVDKDVFELNVFSVISLTRVVVKYFEEYQIQGHVAVTSSLAGIIPAPFSAAYTGAKHAIHGYYNSLRNEMFHKKLSVTVLCPGPTHTNFLSEAFTGKKGEKFEGSVSKTDRRMTAERCGELSAIAIANQIDEAWITIHPYLIMLYFNSLVPNVFRLIMKRLGPEQLIRLRDTKKTLNVE